MLGVRVVVGLLGAALAWAVIWSAIRTVVVPRGEVVWLTRVVFRTVRLAFLPFAKEAHTYERRDRIMARYAPTALMVLPFAWALGVLVGFTMMFWAIDQSGWSDALVSGSSLSTLGFERIEGTGPTLLAILEALIGLGLVALLISFLPAMYGHFSRRETSVAKFYLRALDADGVARPVALIRRAHEIGGLDQLEEIWTEWEQWFVELSETHTSFPALVYFRSPSSSRSWVAASGMVLDTASIFLATVNVTRHPRAALMIHSGFLALRDVCDFFSIPYDPDPRPDDPISVTREEFIAAYESLAAAGVPVRSDREQAWRDYRGWRVNYDVPVTSLASLTMASYAPWVSDRSVRVRQAPMLPKRLDHERRHG